MLTFTAALPDDVKLCQYKGHGIEFAYPDGGQFAEFSHADGSRRIRLIVDYQGTRFHLNLDQMPSVRTARELAHELYEHNPAYAENIPPTLMSRTDVEIWHQRYLFVDGGRDVVLTDVAFIQQVEAVFRLQFTASAHEHTKGFWIFETFLHSILF
jgi:hypothetical protein